jgi:hypothetical protein
MMLLRQATGHLRCMFVQHKAQCNGEYRLSSKIDKNKPSIVLNGAQWFTSCEAKAPTKPS